MSNTEVAKAAVTGTSSQRVADCLSLIDAALQTARKRQRTDEADSLEIREKKLREQLQVLVEFIVSYGTQLIPVAERIARTIVSAVVSRQVAINESWEAAAVFCAYFPSAGAVILSELFEQYLQAGTVWMTTLMGLRYTTVTPRLEAVADMITASISYVESSLAQRFATLFAVEATDIALYRRSQMMGGQSVLVLPHSVNNVFTALLTSLRPCPPSVLAECSDRVSGLRGHSHSLHSVFPKPQTAANKAPSLAAADAIQLSPLPLPFLGAYKLAQESSVRLRAMLAQVLHPRSQPFYQPATSSAVDVWPSAQAPQTATAVASVTDQANKSVPQIVEPSIQSSLGNVAPVLPPASLHPALGGEAPTQVTAPPKKVETPKRHPTPKQKPVAETRPSMSLADLPDIEL